MRKTGTTSLFFCLFLVAAFLAASVPRKLYAEGEGGPLTFTENIYLDEEGDKLRFPFVVYAEPVMNELYVIDSLGRIIIYTSDFFPLITITKRDGIESPQGVVVDDKGTVYIAQGASKDEARGKISVLNACLKWQRDIYFDGFEGSKSFMPYRMAIDKNGQLYVAGLHFPGVVVLDGNDRIVDMMEPLEGDHKAKLNNVVIDKDGKIYLLSEDESRVYVYDANRKFLFKFGEKGGSAGKLSRPKAIGVDSKNGRMYIVDYMRHAINIYDQGGKYLSEFGGLGWGDGWFQHPTDVTVDAAGRVFVTDTFNDRVEVFQAN